MSSSLAAISEQLEIVRKAVTELNNEVQPTVMEFVAEKIRPNVELFFLLKQIKELGKDLERVFNSSNPILAERISDLMNQEELESADFTFENERFRFTPDQDIHASCRAELKPRMIEWLKQHPVGASLIQETVHDKTLNKFIKEEIMGNGKLPPTDIFTLHTVKTLNVRKLPKK